MSHTDKTRPIWVQLADETNYHWRKEVHDHRFGPCTLIFDKDHHGAIDPRFGAKWQMALYYNWLYHVREAKCIFWPNGLAYHGGLYPRRPRKGGRGRPAREAKHRAQWVRLRQDLIKTAWGDWDLVDWGYRCQDPWDWD